MNDRFKRHWALFPEFELAIGAAKKCGSRTLQHMSKQMRCEFRDIPDEYFRVGVIRNPVDRFYSLYWHIRRGLKTPRTRDYFHPYEQSTPDTLWNFISEDLHGDIHHAPQTSIGLLEADHIVRLDDLTDWIAEMGLPKAATLNKGEKPPAASTQYYRYRDPELIEKIRAAYAEDLSIWENAHER